MSGRLTPNASGAPNILRMVLRAREWLEAVPYAVLALPLRLGVAWIFWSSAQVKLINWQRTIELFTEEYRVPLLPPGVAAAAALTIEVTAPVLLALGLFTRFTVLALLGMTAVIEIFVYPEAWPTHLQWMAMMLVLLCRGAGPYSLDHLIWQRLSRRYRVAQESVRQTAELRL